MRTLRWLAATLGLVLALGAARSLPAEEIKLGNQTFTLPDGFEIEQVAGPPLVDRPIVADFDDEGRLYVADSSGTNDNVQKQLAERPHRIVRLEDSDGDGRFDRSIVFAGKMMFPEGAMWREGSLYVAAPPTIWKLTDTDGDGVADRREEWFAGRTLTGCANDLHGPYDGPDGWIYWCKGAFAEQTYDRPGKPPFVTTAAHLFRCRPDGNGIEPVMTGGMDNPVEVVFTAGGERVFTTTFLQHPGGGKRDGLIHAVYGGVYGKVWEPIESHPRTGDVLPVLSHLGAAAPCGLARAEAAPLGGEPGDSLFACCFNMHKVTRHLLTPEGATFRSADSDFLVSDSLDFHPTDVLEDADGSLLVIDTGGWYKLCCPTSQLHKPDVLGAIYRVRRRDARPVEDPRGRKIDWGGLGSAKVADRLADPRPAVRRRAIRELARRGDAAIAGLVSIVRAGQPASATIEAVREVGRPPRMRIDAVWALTRIDRPEARAAVRRALDDEDSTVRQVAAHSASLWRDRLAAPKLQALLSSESPANRRVAAEALGRIGDPASVRPILDASGASAVAADRMLEHSLIFALIEIADPAKTARGLESGSPTTRRVALLALDQMPNGGLEPRTVAALLGSEAPAVKETAAWIVARHPEWGEALAGFLRSRLASKGLSETDALELEQQLSRFAKAASIQQLLARTLDDPASSPQARRIALRAIARSAPREPPAGWIEALTKVLAGDGAELLEPAVLAARALPAPKVPDPKFVEALRAVGARSEASTRIRLDALAAVPGGLAEVPTATFDFLRDKLRPEQDVLVRSRAAEVLARSKLTPRQLAALAEALAIAGPLEADLLLPAFRESADEAVGLKLVASLRASPVLTGLRLEAVKASLAKFPASVQSRAEDLYRLIDVDAAGQKAKLEALLAALKPGDVRRGQAVFHSSKAACSACHPFGYLGGNVGPDLTRIGQVRQGRDLLEAIVFPSASFVRSFEPVVVSTKDGKSYNGLVRKKSSDEVVLATGPQQDVRIGLDEIEEMRPSNVSVMPAGLDQQLSSQDLADLIAFLMAAR